MASYLTLAAQSQAQFVEKRSRFIGFAIPVSTREEAREHIKNF